MTRRTRSCGRSWPIVADKTGYPEDMLEMDLDLEADLGVDTVKQAEVFAAVREAYGIERQENLKLRDFPTLKHVVKFVYDFRPDLKPAAVAAGPVIPRDAVGRVPRDPAGLRIPRRPAGSKLLGMTRVRPRLLRMTRARPSRPRGSWPRSRTPTRCRGACRCRRCGPRSTAASRPASRSRRAPAWSSPPTRAVSPRPSRRPSRRGVSPCSLSAGRRPPRTSRAASSGG